MKQKVLTILEEFGILPITVKDNTHFAKDLGLDSLDKVDLMMRLEQTFGLRIPDEDYSKLSTMKNLMAYLEEEQGVAKVG